MSGAALDIDGFAPSREAPESAEEITGHSTVEDVVRVSQYIWIALCLVGLGLTMVGEHVERTRIGYELRKLEHEHARLVEERRARKLIWERSAAVENVSRKALAMGILSEDELSVLLRSDSRK